MTTCLLASPDCAGDLKPLAVVSDEELTARFPRGAQICVGKWVPFEHGGFAMAGTKRKSLYQLLADPRRFVRCKRQNCKQGRIEINHPLIGRYTVACPACDSTTIAHVCERHREAVCRHGDPTCPCQDGDPCHYEPFDGTAAMVSPLSPDNLAFIEEFSA